MFFIGDLVNCCDVIQVLKQLKRSIYLYMRILFIFIMNKYTIKNIKLKII